MHDTSELACYYRNTDAPSYRENWDDILESPLL